MSDSPISEQTEAGSDGLTRDSAEPSEFVAGTAQVFAADGALAKRAGFVLRPAQSVMAAEIAECIESRAALVAEAGTGTGKTFAYLVPAMLSGAKVLISTGTKYLQDQLVRRDLPELANVLGLSARVALLKGRANYVCRHHLERNLVEGAFERREDIVVLRRIERFAQFSTSGDRAEAAGIPEDAPAWARAVSTRENCLGQDCDHYEKCFVIQARRKAMQAEIVVVNHHLFCADMALREEGVSELLPSTDVIIFDEAHQLPGIATQFFGVALTSRQVLDLARDLVRIGRDDAPEAADWLLSSQTIEAALRDFRLQAGRPARLDDRRLRGMPAFHDAISSLAAAIEALAPGLAEAAPRSRDLGRLAQRASEMSQRLRAWLLGLLEPPESGEPAVMWADVRRLALALHATPLSVAEPFRRYRSAAPRAWIFVSATLTVGGRFDHFQRALGLEDARTSFWPSPFDYARNTRLLVPADVGEPSDDQFAERLAQVIVPLLKANRGRAFVLCTSLRMVARMAELIAAALDQQFELLVQGSAPRALLIERFRQATQPVLIGSASFWEGVDVPGEQLSLVVIDKLPFAPPDDPIVRARAQALREAGEEPFRSLQLPEAAMALKQGAGRLIRSETDRGVLLIGDRRLLSKPYGKTLRDSLPPFTLTRSLDEVIQFIESDPAAEPDSGQ